MKNFANAAAKRINNIHMNLGYIVFECLCVFYSNRIFLRLDVNFFLQYFLQYFCARNTIFFTLFFYIIFYIRHDKNYRQ